MIMRPAPREIAAKRLIAWIVYGGTLGAAVWFLVVFLGLALRAEYFSEGFGRHDPRYAWAGMYVDPPRRVPESWLSDEIFAGLLARYALVDEFIALQKRLFLAVNLIPPMLVGLAGLTMLVWWWALGRRDRFLASRALRSDLATTPLCTDELLGERLRWVESGLHPLVVTLPIQMVLVALAATADKMGQVWLPVSPRFSYDLCPFDFQRAALRLFSFTVVCVWLRMFLLPFLYLSRMRVRCAAAMAAGGIRGMLLSAAGVALMCAGCATLLLLGVKTLLEAHGESHYYFILIRILPPLPEPWGNPVVLLTELAALVFVSRTRLRWQRNKLVAEYFRPG